MHGWMDGWMDRSMNEWLIQWMNEWMNEWMDGWMNEWMNEWIWTNEWMNGSKNMNEWMNEWMDGYMNGWMNEWMNGWSNEWMAYIDFVIWKAVFPAYLFQKLISWRFHRYSLFSLLVLRSRHVHCFAVDMSECSYCSVWLCHNLEIIERSHSCHQIFLVG